MLYLVSKIIQRDRAGLWTSVRLPDHAETLNFLRDFGFPQMLERATSRPLVTLLTNEDRERLARAGEAEVSISDPSPTLPFNFFPLEAVQLTQGLTPAVQYAARWLERHVLAALDRDLHGKGSRVATHVVLEALLAARKESTATCAIIAAYYGRMTDGLPHMQIAIWHDGAGYWHAGERSLELGRRGDGRPAAEPRWQYVVRHRSAGQEAKREVLDDGEVYALSSDSPAFSLQAFQRLSTAGGVSNEGQGFLGTLAGAVLELFGGRLEACSGNQVVRLRTGQATSERREVLAEIEIASNSATDLPYGNILNIVIPLR
jgi:hypothetical protein